jgi:enoyl-CoA hydratase/carnithine racemase
MTRAQLMLAGKLYSLATLAHLDLGDDVSEDEDKVKRNALKRAKSALRRLRVDPSEILTTQDAIDKACELRP